MNTTNLIVTTSLIGQADQLAAEHEQFTEQYVVNGRKALYALLDRIYQLAVQFEASPDKEDLYHIIKRDLTEKHGVRVQANTSDVAMLVRYITRAERKTAHVYARAIESAMHKKIDSVTFAQYVDMAGGLEKIRIDGVEKTLKSPKQLMDEEKTNLSRKFLVARTEFPFAIFKAPEKFDGMTNPNCEFELVICRWIGSEYRVVGKLPPTLDNEHSMLREFSNFLFAEGHSMEEVREAIEKLAKAAEEKREARLKAANEEVAAKEIAVESIEQNTDALAA